MLTVYYCYSQPLVFTRSLRATLPTRTMGFCITKEVDIIIGTFIDDSFDLTQGTLYTHQQHHVQNVVHSPITICTERCTLTTNIMYRTLYTHQQQYVQNIVHSPTSCTECCTLTNMMYRTLYTHQHHVQNVVHSLA